MKTFRTNNPGLRIPAEIETTAPVPYAGCRESREFATEVKFLVDAGLADQIRCWARARLKPDPHGAGPCQDEYRITSLYLDTAFFDVFHRRGSFGKSKYRIRCYDEGACCFLERKLRTRRLLAKRRSLHPLDELQRLDTPALDRKWTGFWFHRRILKRQLRPVCQVSYHRTARMMMTDFGLARLTLDEGLRAVPLEDTGFSPEQGPLLMDDRCVLELKFRHEVPVLFKYLLAEFAISPQAFSKYRLAAAALQLAPDLAYFSPLDLSTDHA